MASGLEELQSYLNPDWSKKADLSRTVPFYPSERYLKEDLAPEQYPLAQLAMIARAKKIADNSDELDPYVRDRILANVLSENRTDYGLNTFVEHDRNIDFEYLRRLGLPVTPYDRERYSNTETHITTRAPKDPSMKDKTWFSPDVIDPTHESLRENALLVLYKLKEKQARFGPKMAIERWNGQGKGAKNHTKKVEEMRRLLNHPSNQQLLDAFNLYYEQSPSGVPERAR